MYSFFKWITKIEKVSFRFRVLMLLGVNKHLSYFFSPLREIARYEEMMRHYQMCQEFLWNISPPQWQKQQETRKQIAEKIKAAAHERELDAQADLRMFTHRTPKEPRSRFEPLKINYRHINSYLCSHSSLGSGSIMGRTNRKQTSKQAMNDLL